MLPYRVKRILVYILQFFEYKCQQSESSRVKGPLAQPLGQVSLPRNVKLRLAGCADHAEQLDRILENFELIQTDSGHVDLLDEAERIFYKYLVQSLVKEYLAQADVFGYDEKQFRNLLSKLDVQFFTIIGCYDSFHVLLLDQVNNLAAIRDYFERLAGHNDLLFVKNLPIREPRHYP